MHDDATTTGLEPPRQPIGLRLFEIALIGLVFFIIGGDPAPHVNEPHYLCRLKHFWNPDYCRGDLFLESADTQLVFIWAFGWVTRYLSFAATAWLGRVIAWTLLAWAWQRLSWRLIPRPLAAVLSAGLFVTLMTIAHLAGEWVVGGVEAKCFAYFFVLLALHALVDRRWNAVWFLLGTTTAFHPIVGGWSGLVCAGIWLADWGLAHFAQSSEQNVPVPLSIGRLAHSFRAMLPGLIAGGIISLVGILPALALTRNVPPDVAAEAARIYVFERLPHHLALLALPRGELVLRIARHAALIVALIVLMRAAKSRVLPIAPLDCIGKFAIGAVLIACAGFAIELVFWNEPLIAAKILRYYWFRLTDVAVPLAVALYSTALIAAGIERRQTWAMWGLTLAIVLVGWQLSTTARNRALIPFPPADNKARDFAAWVDACQWIAENTPPNALFLTPRLSQSFKWRTGRAEVATRKDIPQDAASMVKWFDRLKNIFAQEVNGERQWIDSPSELSTERVRELAHEYHFDYVLADRSQLLSLPIVYKNQEYVVYRIPD
jgi:hypothetical protein